MANRYSDTREPYEGRYIRVMMSTGKIFINLAGCTYGFLELSEEDKRALAADLVAAAEQEEKR